MDDYHIGFTHLYNAMSGNDHRNPGVLAAALNKGKYAEIIYDKHHVSTPSFQIAKKSIPFLYTITDSIGVSGLIDGEYNFAGANIEKRSGTVKIKGEDTLAGSIVTMEKTFLNLLEANCTTQEAVSLTSYNASKYLREDSFGEISVSKKANFLILDKNFNINGKEYQGFWTVPDAGDFITLYYFDGDQQSGPTSSVPPLKQGETYNFSFK